MGKPRLKIVNPGLLKTLHIYRNFVKDSLKTLESLTCENVDLYQFSMFGKNFFLVLDPDLIERILVDEYNIFDKTMKGVDSYKGKTLLDPPGDKIRTKIHIARSKLSREYQSMYLDLMNDILHDEMSRLNHISLDDNVIDLHQEIEYILLRIIFRIFFSKEIGEEHRFICEYIHDISKFMKKRALAIVKVPMIVPTPSNRKFKEKSKKIDEMTEDLILSRINTEDKPNDLLTEIVTKEDEDGKVRTYEEMYNDIITILPAAYETPAKAITFSLYNILTHTEIYDKILFEIEENQFESLDLAIKESLRLNPPVWILSRKNTQKLNLDNLEVSSNSVFLFSQFQMHRHPKYWENPKSFDPSRFTEGSQPYHQFAFFPFGGGPSRCVGHTFANQLMPEIIKALLTNFEIELVDKSGEMILDTGITLYPKNGLHVILHRKNKLLVDDKTEEKLAMEGLYEKTIQF